MCLQLELSAHSTYLACNTIYNRVRINGQALRLVTLLHAGISRDEFMTKITFVSADGAMRNEVEAENGSTVMENAIRNGIPGIDAECGGACACATCHVYVDEDWTDVVGGPEPMEEDMLDFAYDVRGNSRLSCQIIVRDELEGLVVQVPERQS